MNRRVHLFGNFIYHTNASRQVCEDLALRLTDSGWGVLTASGKPNPVARLLDMTTSAWRNRDTFSVAQVDVFSGRAFFWAEVVCWVLCQIGKPYVLTLHGGHLPAFAARHPHRVRRLLHSAAAVTAPSGYLQQAMRPYCRSVLLLPNPLDLSRYSFRVRRRPTPTLVWLRAFDAIYNPPLAVRVLAVLRPEFRKIRLIMVGPDKGDSSLAKTVRLAEKLGVTDRCVFAGRIKKDDVPTWVNQGDIFLNTTNVDNTPVSVLEAMACGLCVVSTNVGGIPYLLEHEHDSLLVPARDAERMALAVRRLLTDSELAERVSCNARSRASLSDWSVVLPQWESLLSAVAEGRRL